MPAPKKNPLHTKYHELLHESIERGEQRDCSVICVAAAFDISYKEAHKLLAKYGRKKGRGVYFTDLIEDICDELGYNLEEYTSFDFIRKFYPEKWQDRIANVTTHHADRFPEVFKDKRVILVVPKHVTALVNGENHDWSRGRALRARTIYVVTKKEMN